MGRTFGGRCKTGEHVILSTRDLRSNGRCAKCCLRAEREYRQRCREAYAARRAAALD